MARKSTIAINRSRITKVTRNAFSTASKGFGRPDLVLKDDQGLKALRKVVASSK